jgi:hypothetical protein
LVMQLTGFQRAVLDKILAGDHPALAVLRAQAASARVVRSEYTGAWFWVFFEVADDAPVLSTSIEDFHLGDVQAHVEGLNHGAGFVLFVKEGRLDNLEGYSYDEPWPEVIADYTLGYECEPRELNLPEMTA